MRISDWSSDVCSSDLFDEFLTHWAEDRPDRVAMREEGRVFTYGEIEDRTARVASALLAAGLKMGDRIAWIGKNSDLYFTLFFGAARAGIVMAPIGWRLSPAQWAFIVNDTRPQMRFTGPALHVVPPNLPARQVPGRGTVDLPYTPPGHH